MKTKDHFKDDVSNPASDPLAHDNDDVIDTAPLASDGDASVLEGASISVAESD